MDSVPRARDDSIVLRFRCWQGGWVATDDLKILAEKDPALLIRVGKIDEIPQILPLDLFALGLRQEGDLIIFAEYANARRFTARLGAHV